MNDHTLTIHNPASYWKLTYQFQTKSWWIEDERQQIGPYATADEATGEAEFMYGTFETQLN